MPGRTDHVIAMGENVVRGVLLGLILEVLIGGLAVAVASAVLS